MIQYLERKGLPSLACRLSPARDPSLPTVMFCGGYRSDMQGTKATFLENQCRARGQGYICFDYSGHGLSEGDFMQGTIGTWRDDALAVLDTLTAGKVLMIGSSMGGWIALLLGLLRPARVGAIIGIAAAPDFTQWIEGQLTATQRHDLDTKGYVEEPTGYSPEPYRYTKALIEEGRAHLLMAQGSPIAYAGPVRLLQGMKDTMVDWQTAHRLRNALLTTDCQVFLVESGDHSLSRPADLALLGKTVVDLDMII